MIILRCMFFLPYQQRDRVSEQLLILIILMVEESIYHPHSTFPLLRIMHRTVELTLENPFSYPITKAIILGLLY